MRLPQVVAQTRRAVAFLARYAKHFGGDAQNIHLCGHSSGAHLAAMLLVTDWSALSTPADVIKSAT